MQLSETVKLYPTEYQKTLITQTMTEYINTVNSLVSDAASGRSIAKTTTADVSANLPSALLNQCIRDAKSIVKKHYKGCHKAVLKNRGLAKRGSAIKTKAPNLPILKKPCCYINNQNYRLRDNCIEFPVMVNGNVMGVDLGIKCPAVSYCSDGTVKFYGNGRKSKYMRRHYAYLRKKLQTSKKMKAVKRINDKEQRIMRDIDHKLSHDIIKTAVAHNVKVIKLEQLQNIRSTTRKSRKNNHSLHTWSFYRLAQFIEYKAKLAGISVEYVNPAYTSQTCPVCGSVHHANDRDYTCECGFHIHRDLLGAMNICNSTEFVGNRQTA